MRKWWNQLDKKKLINALLFVCMVGIFVYAFTTQVYATGDGAISIDIASSDGTGSLSPLDIMFLLVILTVLPSMVLLCTCFTRIIIVFSLLRSALGTQQSPPNQVLIGLAMFMTLFIMQPTINVMLETAYEPYKAGELTSEEAFEKAKEPIKEFMLKQVDKDSLSLFMEISNTTIEIEDGTSSNEALFIFFTAEVKITDFPFASSYIPSSY